MDKKLDLKSNRIKFVSHGFFFSTAIHVAEPSTLLPLMIKYFTHNNILIGLFSSLVRGGAVLMQLYTAYFAQSYKKVMRTLRILFFFRFISWFFIGLSIYFIGNKNPSLTLWCIGIGLFLFSFCAGFGTVLFHELLGKIFTNKYRGVTWAYRQFFMGVGGILSAFFTTYLFHRYDKPLSFALAFVISGIFMAIGYILLGTITENTKMNITKRESNFSRFLKNSFAILSEDKRLNMQIIVCLLSYSYLLVLPFIVKYTKLNISIAGLALGSAVPLLAGSVISNILWVRLSGKGNDKLIIQISFIYIILSLIIATFATSIYLYVIIYLLAGAASDGFRLSFKNLILGIAPEKKRPVYFAVQNNITSLGMFFSIPGGWVLNYYTMNSLIIFVLMLLVSGFILSFRLQNC